MEKIASEMVHGRIGIVELCLRLFQRSPFICSNLNKVSDRVIHVSSCNVQNTKLIKIEVKKF
jgi:hypothetical protein